MLVIVPLLKRHCSKSTTKETVGQITKSRYVLLSILLYEVSGKQATGVPIYRHWTSRDRCVFHPVIFITVIFVLGKNLVGVYMGLNLLHEQKED
jgi:hypothetical protein